MKVCIMCYKMVEFWMKTLLVLSYSFSQEYLIFEEFISPSSE